MRWVICSNVRTPPWMHLSLPTWLRIVDKLYQMIEITIFADEINIGVLLVADFLCFATNLSFTMYSFPIMYKTGGGYFIYVLETTVAPSNRAMSVF